MGLIELYIPRFSYLESQCRSLWYCDHPSSPPCRPNSRVGPNENACAMKRRWTYVSPLSIPSCSNWLVSAWRPSIRDEPVYVCGFCAIAQCGVDVTSKAILDGTPPRVVTQSVHMSLFGVVPTFRWPIYRNIRPKMRINLICLVSPVLPLRFSFLPDFSAFPLIQVSFVLGWTSTQFASCISICSSKPFLSGYIVDGMPSTF